MYDKNARPICIGDVLKIYHFTGARRKKYYMYKLVTGFSNGRFVINHLERNPDDPGDNYSTCADGKIHNDIEIVQGYGDDGVHFERRKKLN